MGVCHLSQVLPGLEKPNTKKANAKSNVPAVERKSNCDVYGRDEMEQLNNSEVEVRDEAENGMLFFTSDFFTPEEGKEPSPKKSSYIPK